MKRPELMSPIKNFASLEACKNYADAVYFGISEFNLRSRATDITIENLKEFVEKCHSYNIKAYMTLNSIIYNQDIERLDKIIRDVKGLVDAVIVWDIAAIEICREHKIPFFISTQANISNWKTAEFYQRLGAKRIVLSREMSLSQIKEITGRKLGIEIEVFVHGAMCMAISGRCLLSNYFWGKSSNKGLCGQPCRKAWRLSDNKGLEVEVEENNIEESAKEGTSSTYFMNAKDLCMIEFVPQLMEIGIDSFKIEGRMRDPSYIKEVSRCYREAIDSVLAGTFNPQKVTRWKNDLSLVFNRGFSTGFYFSQPTAEGISYNQIDNISPIEKILVGKVVHFYNKINVALIQIEHTDLKVGEEITIEDKEIFLRQRVEMMEIDNQPVELGQKGEEIGLKVDQPVKKGCNLFVYRRR